MLQPPSETRDFSSLVEVVKALRGPDGCPWDKQQTPYSLIQYAIEEAHELVEAIEANTSQEDIIEELGDVLLQVVLHSEIARQENRFDIHDVIESINKKMIRRHPHVFSNKDVKDTDEVVKNWQEIKDEEKKGKPEKKKFDIPENLPALQRSSKIGKKTKKLNFDWENHSQVLEKVEEELLEVKEAIAKNGKEEIENEIGDLLFSVSQLARHLDIEPEQSLRKANRRFEKRFFILKDKVDARGKSMKQLSTEELEEVWVEVKEELKNARDS